jgi:HAD superfamily hydrolase (TIGR01493 family)
MSELRTPSFLYFDLGNVLLFFDHEQGCRQMAAVAGIEVAQVREAVFGSGLEYHYEAGEMSTTEFYEEFCRATGARPNLDQLAYAAAAIFQLNVPIKAVLAQLASAGYRLGLLSNTCEIHWNYFADGRYSLIPEVFDTLALSFQIGALKPDPKIYLAAAELAGVAPQDVFFVDDIAGHVAGAKAVGFDAVQYTSTPALVSELRKRGVEFNY